MIKVTRLNGKEFVLNAEMIRSVEETPDTLITLVGDKTYIVQEKADDVIKKAVEYGRTIRTFVN